MSKFGEGKLGSTQFAEPSDLEVAEEIEQEVRERAEAVMKSVYPTDPGTDWDKLLEVILEEFEREHQVIDAILSGRYIDDATGAQLNKIGEFWQVERRDQEGDDLYRARIKAQFPRHTSRATIDEVIEASATLLDTHPQRFDIHENFDIEPARFDIVVEEIALHDAGVSIDDYQQLIQDIKPAGVKAVATIGSQFTYRSHSDFDDGVNDANKGYDDYDPNNVTGYDPDNPTNDSPASPSGPLLGTGGAYADEITIDLT